MGWTGNENWVKKADVVASISQDLADCYKVLGFKSNKTGVWAVVQPEGGTPFILVYLVSKEQGTYAYKDMDESMGPYYYDCPKEFLDLAPISNLSWRSKVYQYWQDKKGGAQ